MRALVSIMRIVLTKSIKPFIFHKTSEAVLPDMEKFGLYIHIPFCRTLCDFCPYYKTKYEVSAADAFKAALLNEIRFYGRQCGGEKHIVSSVYFGGGTPALMGMDLKDIISAIRESFQVRGEIAIELHPEDITEKQAVLLREAGFTMVSVGIQSFHPLVLGNLKRDFSSRDILISKIALLERTGFSVIDVDLIFGLQGQSAEIVISDIDTAFQAGATQVSTYPFIQFSYTNSNRLLPTKAEQYRSLASIVSYVEKSPGINRTSVWTFGKKGVSKYSSVTRNYYLGFGPSAASLTKTQFNVNTFSLGEYINAWSRHKAPEMLRLNFTKRQRAAYFLFWNTYSLFIDSSGFEDLTGVSLEKMFGFALKCAEKLKWIKHVKNGYQVTESGAHVFHFIEQVYTHNYIDKVWKLTEKSGFPEKMKLRG